VLLRPSRGVEGGILPGVPVRGGHKHKNYSEIYIDIMVN
jgi:hypothetical protein